MSNMVQKFTRKYSFTPSSIWILIFFICLKNKSGILDQSMLDTFPKNFFPNGNFPNVQFPKRQLPKSVLAAALSLQHVIAAALGPLAHPSHSAQPSLQPAAPQRAQHNLWECCGLGNCTFRKLSLVKSPLGICLWEST